MLSRLLRPRSIAVVGGGEWGRAVLTQSLGMGFQGSVHVVHPTASEISGVRAYSSIKELPSPPDACFIGVNRLATIDIVAQLATAGAGGATCFASGFAEARAEDADGADLQARLRASAGDMPLLGPNCYGFVNALDGAVLWPDQHGCARVKNGVAILTQSSNIAINLTMQTRGLPVGFIGTAGNQALVSQADLAAALLEDARITAIGLHIEGFQDLRAWESMADRAHYLGKPLVALKAGRSAQARAATLSHTASVAGADAGADAFLRRLGIARVDSISALLETLKLLHVAGPLTSGRIASISCSGGEAALVADTAHGRKLQFPALNASKTAALRGALGPMVALANPLDYHTYIWRDIEAMTRAWSAMIDPSLALTMLVVDFPRSDRCDAGDWRCATEAALNVKARTGANVAMVSTLPELMPEQIADQLIAEGITPLNGLTDALIAVETAANILTPTDAPVLLPRAMAPPRPVTEAAAKRRLAAHGFDIPRSYQATDPRRAAEGADLIGYPVVLKGEGFAHKTEAGAVIVNLRNAVEVEKAARQMKAESYLVEEMISPAVAELLIGVIADPAHGHVLTLGEGGVLTEILRDSRSLLIPANDDAIIQALTSLKISALLKGYRGQPAANITAILGAINALQAYVLANPDRVSEIEINPLICTATRAVAADALLQEAP